MSPLKWGILSTGFIAGRFADGLSNSASCQLEAVYGRDPAKAQTFAETHQASRWFSDLDAFLAHSEIEAVYIATPHPLHHAMSLAAIKAGKHVLCEKPIGMNAEEAREIYEAAHARGVIVMEAFMYRCHPQTARVLDIVRNGTIGTPQFIEARFGFRADFSPSSRLFDRALGGGAILDIGCYSASFAHLVANAAGQNACQTLQGFGKLHPETKADVRAAAQMTFQSGLQAQLTVSIESDLGSEAIVWADGGWLRIAEPWIIASHGGKWSFEYHSYADGKTETEAGHDARELYQIEAEHVADLIQNRADTRAATPPSESIEINQTLDLWRKSVGVTYSTDRS